MRYRLKADKGKSLYDASGVCMNNEENNEEKLYNS